MYLNNRINLMGFNCSTIIGLILLISVVSCQSKNEKKSEIDKTYTIEKPELLKRYWNDAEKIDNPTSKFPKMGVKSSGLFGGAELRTQDFAFSGKYSLKVGQENEYAFGIKFPVEAQNFIEVTIWRKKCSDCGKLVIKNGNNKLISTNDVVIQETKKWEKLYTTAQVSVANELDKEINVFYMNNSNNITYVDKIDINVYKKKVRPDFPELQKLYIQIDKKDFKELNKDVAVAKNLGILLAKHKEKYKAKIALGDKELKAKVRLKGDWADHLEEDKWSFRIEIEDEESVFGGVKEFSVQNPKTRHFLAEYALHNLADSLNMLTTRYGFIQLIVNGQNLGMYAYEEHFTKQLVESRKRREGPIVKFDEEPFWNQNRYNHKLNKDQEKAVIPFYEAAQVLPYDYKKTTKSEPLFSQFKQAVILMEQFKNNLEKSANIFDVNAFAKFAALCDLGQVSHSQAWHNQRFYYNPVINKLEPILFDCYTDYWLQRGEHKMSVVNYYKDTITGKPDHILFKTAFLDRAIKDAYINTLINWTSSSDFKKLLKSVCKEASQYEPLLQREFPGYQFNYLQTTLTKIDEVANTVEKLDSELAKQEYKFRYKKYTSPQPFVKGAGIVANYNFISNEIELRNYHSEPIEVTGLQLKKDSVFTFESPVKLVPFYTYPAKIYTVKVPFDKKATVLFKTPDSKVREADIYPWPILNNQKTALQDYVNNANIPLPHTMRNDTVWITPGKHTLNQPMVINAGNTLALTEGTSIDLINGAKIICFDNISFQGSKTKPIRIFSNDKTGQGLFVLQAKSPSYLKHVIFDGLNTSLDKDWTLTGAVTFYESDVVMNHVTVKNNSCEDALNIIRSDFNIKNLAISETYSDGFDADYCTGILDSSSFTNTGNDCIDFSTSEITISNIQIKNSGDKGISGGEASTLVIKNVTIDGAAIGIASKDRSELLVDNINISNAKYGLAAFQKKPEYGPANINATNILLNNIENPYILEINSGIIWDGKIHVGNKKLDLDQLYDL